MLARQRYVRMERVLNGSGMDTVVLELDLLLDREAITAEGRSFLLKDVYDISYRIVGGQLGILYLHTSSGVYPFNVEEDPAAFILAFKQTAPRR
ncbi:MULTISPECIES: hypothetical protein [unclassified Paenibacillus]|uniref:hypothetical protein n=1 Tax=unclassified Paenibacillus TaxID=185978 RepID=UPI0009548934|nr:MULTISPECIES: hypothetical protein [unclassified Paenibacillus]ASS65231.1 hypothetical protein CIC07_03180 [Paenibacillus sp. RUD330]SIQ43333.1 hypothetical protein SAMN05880555_1728 [Paenibacillus sp. RU4X]SIQ65608.1 hypothetical protein SAMN05880570_1726 [Paenibacillus sp. RU4T]